MAELYTLFAVLFGSWLFLTLSRGVTRLFRTRRVSPESELLKNAALDRIKVAEEKTRPSVLQADAINTPNPVIPVSVVNGESIKPEPIKERVVDAVSDPEIITATEGEPVRDAVACPHEKVEVSSDPVWLTFRRGELDGQSLILPEENLVFGRNPNSVQILLTNVEISARHLSISHRTQPETELVVEDLQSTNGSRFRNTRIGLDSWQRLGKQERFGASDIDGLEVELADGVVILSLEQKPA